MSADTAETSQWCGHFSLDFNGACMTCAREARRRADMAQAWNEGLEAGRDRWADAREFGAPPVNPYGDPS